jgi:hypothetical protein
MTGLDQKLAWRTVPMVAARRILSNARGAAHWIESIEVPLVT